MYVEYDKRNYKKAFKQYNKAVIKYNKIDEEKQNAQKELEEDKKELISTALTYYTYELRIRLFEQAEKVNYSNDLLKRIKGIKPNEWDKDKIDVEIIHELYKMEEYIDEHTPFWENSFITKLGQQFCNDKEG